MDIPGKVIDYRNTEVFIGGGNRKEGEIVNEVGGTSVILTAHSYTI